MCQPYTFERMSTHYSRKTPHQMCSNQFAECYTNDAIKTDTLLNIICVMTISITTNRAPDVAEIQEMSWLWADHGTVNVDINLGCAHIKTSTFGSVLIYDEECPLNWIYLVYLSFVMMINRGLEVVPCIEKKFVTLITNKRRIITLASSETFQVPWLFSS